MINLNFDKNIHIVTELFVSSFIEPLHPVLWPLHKHHIDLHAFHILHLSASIVNIDIGLPTTTTTTGTHPICQHLLFLQQIIIAHHDEALAIASMGVFSFCRGGRYSGEGSKGAFAFQPKYKSAHPHLIITLEQLSGQAMLKTFRFLILEIPNLSNLALSVATCHQCN